MQLTWQQPQNYRNRPVVVLGAGVLGRRIGCIWASAGYEVRIRDPSPQQRADGLAYIQENVHSYAMKTGQTPGKFSAHQDLKEAVSDAWLIIEAVPEKLDLKVATFAELEATAPEDCILASNSSSYKSSEMIERVSDATKARILNMHYYMPPGCMIVELMTDGYTDEGVFPFMVERSREAATLPYVARKQSTGFIFNRLWAAVKREVLTILAEGVSVPEEIDSMWVEMFIKPRNLPCRTMDQVGLDTVAFIESHYVQERGLPSEKTVDYLKKYYLDDGKLGNKSPKGGLYVPAEEKSTANEDSTGPKILVLDIGLSAANPTNTSGEILELSSDGKVQRVLAPNQSLPDGIAVDSSTGRMFWTCMGVPGKDDGAIYSANLDGSGIQTVVPQGKINTPKQLAIDAEAAKVYFCDREGCQVWRCNFDGSDLEAIIDRGDSKGAQEKSVLDWCVGVTVAPSLGKFFWTQKGPSKGGKGRIFCANIRTPEGQTGTSRNDIQLVLGDLPEPIDLEIDEQSNTLYWTDRGEVPFGNALYKAQLNESGLPVPLASNKKYECLTKHLKEAIGLKLDLDNGHIYLTDLGGNVYRCNLDGSQKKKIHSNDYRAFTGIALL